MRSKKCCSACPQFRGGCGLSAPGWNVSARLLAPVVVLAPATTLTTEEMIDHLRASGLATYKSDPDELKCVPELPTTPTGKVQKHLIVATLTSPKAAIGERA